MTTRRNVIFAMGAAAMGAVAGAFPTVTVSRPGTAFGTIVNVEVTAASQAQAQAALDMAFAEIRAVHQAASLFDATSEVSRLNAAGFLRRPTLLLQDIIAQADQCITCREVLLIPACSHCGNYGQKDRLKVHGSKKLCFRWVGRNCACRPMLCTYKMVLL
jgi:hypothetical protein